MATSTVTQQETILSMMLGRGNGGLENVFVQHTLSFQAMGYRSVAICHHKSPLVKALRAAGIEVFTISRQVFNPLAWSALIRILRQVRADVLCMHGNRALSFGTARFLRAFVRPFPKLMATTHNARNKRFPKLDGCFAITHVLEKSLIKDFGILPSKIFYCPNAVECPKACAPRVFRSPLTLGFLGRFHPVKGGDLLLEAMRRLKAMGVAIRLEMAGDGALRESYEAFVKAHHLEDVVSFCGWIGEAQKEAFFKRIDCLCLPSRSEGLPVSLLEALSYGVPIAASRCPGMVEVVDGSQCGVLFPIEDVDALVAALQGLTSDRAQWEAFSVAARKAFELTYNTDQQKVFLKQGVEAVCDR